MLACFLGGTGVLRVCVAYECVRVCSGRGCVLLPVYEHHWGPLKARQP